MWGIGNSFQLQHIHTFLHMHARRDTTIDSISYHEKHKLQVHTLIQTIVAWTGTLFFGDPDGPYSGSWNRSEHSEMAFWWDFWKNRGIFFILLKVEHDARTRRIQWVQYTWRPINISGFINFERSNFDPNGDIMLGKWHVTILGDVSIASMAMDAQTQNQSKIVPIHLRFS